MFRKIVAATLMLLAVVFWLGPALGNTSDINDYDEKITDALVEDTLNNTRAEGAPQQQVVNGWTARNLLEIQAQQANDILSAQNRIASLLTLALFGIGLLALSRRPDAAPQAPDNPNPATSPTAVDGS